MKGVNLMSLSVSSKGRALHISPILFVPATRNAALEPKMKSERPPRQIGPHVERWFQLGVKARERPFRLESVVCFAHAREEPRYDTFEHGLREDGQQAEGGRHRVGRRWRSDELAVVGRGGRAG